MKKCIVLLALAIATLAGPVLGVESSPWDKLAVAPYASSLKEACRTAPVAIGGFAIPPEVKDHFMQVLGTTCKSEKDVWLTPGFLLEQMWSGPDSRHKEPHVMDKKKVGELPVSESPDGRPYRKGSVAETVKTLSWTFVYEGKTYILYLPYVCFNWSWAFGPAPMLVERCATVEYTVAPGDEVPFAVFARKRLPASACWRLCDGDTCSALPSPCDTCDWNDLNGPKSVIPDGFEPLHSGKHIARNAKQTLRFPWEVTSEYIALCVARDGLGESDAWVIPPSVWDGEVTTISIPYGGQEFPAWGQVDYSRWREVPRKE